MAAGRFRPAASPANLDFGAQIRLPRCSASGTRWLAFAKSVNIRAFYKEPVAFARKPTLGRIRRLEQLYFDEFGRMLLSNVVREHAMVSQAKKPNGALGA